MQDKDFHRVGIALIILSPMLAGEVPMVLADYFMPRN